MIFRKYPFIALDIETRNLTAAQAEFAAQFLKHHPNTKDEAKRAAQIAAKKAALSGRGALNDASEVACVGFWSPSEPAPIVLHTFPFGEEIEGIAHAQYATEKKMLEALAEMMNDACDEQTEVVVANAGFDLPRLRYAAAIRNRVAVPEIIKPRSVNPIYDVLHMAGKYFLVGGGAEFSLSLDDLAKHCRITTGKVVSGAEVPGMIDREEYEEVITYNAVDALLTGRAYQILTGR
jgi:hypothetical protein